MKPGDKVIRVGPTQINGPVKGSMYIVERVTHEYVRIKGMSGEWGLDRFEVIKAPKNKRKVS